MNSKVKRTNDQQETIALLNELLKEAESGAIDGLACVAITRDHLGHLRDASGSAVRYAAHTLGALKMLSDDLSQSARSPEQIRPTTQE